MRIEIKNVGTVEERIQINDHSFISLASWIASVEHRLAVLGYPIDKIKIASSDEWQKS